MLEVVYKNGKKIREIGVGGLKCEYGSQLSLY